jgi:parvulin-like peptidyl-prolyl isomerase
VFQLKNVSVISALIAGTALGATLVGIVSCNKGGGAGGDIVATVNGTPISKEEFLQYMMLKQSVKVMSNRGAVDAKVASPLGFQTLDDLVKQKLLIQMAKTAGVYPTDADVAKEINFQVEGDPNFVKNLTRQGMNTDMIRNALAVEISQRNLLTRGITVTDSDITNYIASHKKQFTVPESYDIVWVVVKNQADEKAVDDELKHGQDFAEVAKKYSIVPHAKEDGGMFNRHHLDEIPYPKIKDAIKKTPELKSTDWIPSDDQTGFAKFYVAKITPAKPVDMTDHLKEVLRRSLAMDKGSQAQDLQTQVTKQEVTSNVNIQMTGLQDIWKAYINSIQQQQAVPSLQGAMGGPAGSTTAGTLPGGASPSATAGSAAPTGTAATPPATTGGK